MERFLNAEDAEVRAEAAETSSEFLCVRLCDLCGLSLAPHQTSSLDTRRLRQASDILLVSESPRGLH